jgi:imidazolonepropionase
MRLLIKNIKALAGVYEHSPDFLSGPEMARLPVIKNAFLAIEDGKIAGYGSMSEWEGISDWNGIEIIDADGKYVLPAWCDSHTHLVFAGSREGEFVDRIHGLTYAEIAAKGGGILNSANKLANTPEDVLFESASKRLEEVMRMGTGAIEIKSGYGLSLEAELKMLRVIKRLKESSPVTIKATLLAAHAVPAAYKERKDDYINLIIDQIMPAVANEGLADFVDVFCETNYFSVADTDRILEAGAKFGLIPKIHVNQFTAIGGIGVGVKHNALSVDHLEVMNDEDFEVLKGSRTMPTSLPSCSFFLGIPYTPARKIIDSGLPLALASDYNPGSTPSGNMPFVVSLGCIKMKMTPEEAINAATLNSAYAMGVQNQLGSLSIGKTANVIITQPMPSLAFLPYSFGSRLVETVIINGIVQ